MCKRYGQDKCRVQYESVPQAVSQVLLVLRNPKLVRYGEDSRLDVRPTTSTHSWEFTSQ